VDHLAMLEEQARQTFLTKQHLVGVVFDIEEAYDIAWRYRSLQTLYHWNLKGQRSIFFTQVYV
jgi:hypothetical protein